MLDALLSPWPWYVAGPLVGLTVPALLILGNKSFGISSSMRHICAACIPANIPFFKYNWKKEAWNLVFVAGIIVGSALAIIFLGNPKPVEVDTDLFFDLAKHGIASYDGLMPKEIFSWDNLFTVQGIIFTVVGGFLVGFGTRWAGGCTSGHSIMGLSNLQLPSLIATCCFMIGGILVSNFVVPFLLGL